MGLDLPGISEDEWTEFVRGRFAERAQARTSSLGFRAQTNERIGSLSSLSAPSVPMLTLPQMPQIPTPQLPQMPEIPRPSFPQPQIPGFPGQAQPTPSPAPLPGPSPAPAPRLGFPTIRPRPGREAREQSFRELSQAHIDSLAAPPEPARRPALDFRNQPRRAPEPMPTVPGQQLPGALPTTPVGRPALPHSEEPATATDTVDSKWKTSFDHKAIYTGSYRTGTPHRGIDLVPHKGGIGTPIEAFHPGTVSLIQRDSGGAGGLMVYVKDDQGLTHAYMHLQGTRPDLKVGMPVQRGEPIAFMGESGTEGSPHLHYEVRRGLNGDPLDNLIDPRPYMKGAGQPARPGQRPSAGAVNPNPTPGEVRSYITQAAQQRGIDPDIALKVAQSEGGFEAARRGTFKTGSSWWPFQLHYGGKGYEELGNVAGMGNSFTAQTGYQPGDPNAWQAATDYALDRVQKAGWGDWYGAKAQGITGMMGVGQAPPPGARSTPVLPQLQMPGEVPPLPEEYAPPVIPQTTAPPRPPMFAPRSQAQPQLGSQSTLGGVAPAEANPIEQIGTTIAKAITEGLSAVFGGAPGGPPGGQPGGGETEEDRRAREERRRTGEMVFPTLPEYMRVPEPGRFPDPLERFRDLAKKGPAEGLVGAAMEASEEAMQRPTPGFGPGGLSLLDPRLSDPGADVDFGDLGRAAGALGDIRGGAPLEATTRRGEVILDAARRARSAVQGVTDVVGAPLRAGAEALGRGARAVDEELDAAAEKDFTGPIADALGELERRPMTRQEVADAQAALAQVRQTGDRAVGMPQQYATPEGLARLRARLKVFAEMGESQKDWYSDSSEAIKQIAQGNLQEAERLAQLVAIYSPNTPVDANMNNALMAWYQWKNGEPIKVAMGPQDKRASDLLYDNKVWEGRKTNNFYRNLMQHIDPQVYQSLGKQTGQSGVTADIWMMRAFDYLAGPNREGRKWLKAPSDPQYDFIQDEVARVGSELGWTPEQTQAAIWSSVKAAAEGSELTEAGFHYGSALEARMAQVSYTASPGSSEMQKIPGYLEAPEEQRAAYNLASDKALRDPRTGEDIIAREYGLPRGKTLEAPEVYGDYVGPGLQAEIPVPSHRTSRVEPVLDAQGRPVLDEEGRPKTRSMPIRERFGQVHPSARAALNAYSATRGILLKQDAVPWTRVFFANAPLRDSNVVQLHIGRPLSSGEAQRINQSLMEQFGTGDTHAVVATPEGAWLLNLNGRFERDPAVPPNVITTPFKRVETGEFNARGQKVWGKAEGPFVREENVVGTWQPTQDWDGNTVFRPNEDFWKDAQQALARVDLDDATEANLTPLRGDGEYVANDWENHPNGENYRSLLESSGRAETFARLEPALAARVQEAQADVARRFGWPDNPNNPYSGGAPAARPAEVRGAGLPSNVGQPIEPRAPPGGAADLVRGLAGREEGAASPLFAARAGSTVGGGALGYATTPEDASPEERLARTAAGAGIGLGLGAAATRSRAPALAHFDLAKLPPGASPEARQAAVDAQKILKSREGVSSSPLTPDDVKRVLNATVQLKENVTDRRAKLKATEDYLEKKNGSLPYEDSAWLRARVYEGHKDAAWATTQAYVGDSWGKLDAAERDILDVVYEQRDNIDKARSLARRKEAEILGVDLGDVAGKAAFDTAERRVRGYEQAISRASAAGKDITEINKRLASAKKVLERRQQAYETNIAKARTSQEQIAKTEGEILFDRRQFSGGATAQSYDAVRDWVEAMMGNESAAKIFNAMDDGYALVKHYRQRMVESRLITKEFGDYLEKNFPNYVPIDFMDPMSIKGMDDLPHGAQSFGVSGHGIHRIGEASQTGARQPPRRSIMDMAFSIEEAAQRNDLMHRASMWADDPDMGNFVKKLGPDDSAPEGFTSISYMDADKGKQRLAVTNELVKGFSLARPEIQGLYGTMLNAARMPLQAGATALRPGFVAFNMANDTIWTLYRFVSEANSPGEVATALTDFAKGYTAQIPTETPLIGRLGDPKLLERYRRSGSSIGMQSRWEARPDMLLRELHGEKSIPVRTVRSEEGMQTFLKDVWGATTDVAGIPWSRPIGKIARPTERAPRIAAFARAERRAGTTATEAAQAARTVTADFDAGGYTTKMFNQVVPFLNATTQASAEAGGLLGRKPVQATATLAAIMAPVVMTEIYNRAVAPEEYKNVSQKTKDTGLVIMYQNPLSDGAWEPFYVPMRGLLGSPIPALRELIGRSFGDNPRTYEELLWATAGSVSPIEPDVGGGVTAFIPPPAKLGAELLANYDIYRGQPIVSQGMQNRPPEYQYGPQTSQTARALSRSDLPGVGGQSPMKIDYAVKGFSPGPGEALLGAADALIRNFGSPQPEHPDKKTGIRDIPLAGGVLGRFFRTVGEQEQSDAYALAERMTQRNRRVMLDALEASPAWKSATHERRMQLASSLERQLVDQTRALAGVEARQRDLGLPNKYMGVNDPDRQDEIDEAISMVQDYRRDPRRSVRPTGRQVQLARAYAKRVNPRYTAMSRRQGQETTELGMQVGRQLASSERR